MDSVVTPLGKFLAALEGLASQTTPRFIQTCGPPLKVWLGYSALVRYTFGLKGQVLHELERVNTFLLHYSIISPY